MGVSCRMPRMASSRMPDRWLLIPARTSHSTHSYHRSRTSASRSIVSGRCIGLIHRNDMRPLLGAQVGLLAGLADQRGIVPTQCSAVTDPAPVTSRVCGHGWIRRNLSHMRRSVVDYGLARRATLASVLAGRTTVTDVCDAHPYLLRAAKFHGEPTDVTCPICRKMKLTHVTYVYGDELGRYEGRVKRGSELDEMAAEYGEFRVYVV